MLRMGRKLKPRISNHLAVFSAVLLLVTCFAGTGNPAAAPRTAPGGQASASMESGDPAGDAFPTVRKNSRRVSLMLFH